MIDFRSKPQSKWLDVPGAAVHAAISERSIRRLILRGKLTAHRPVRGRIVIDSEELDRYIAASVPTPRKGRGRKQRTQPTA